ncbi:MAG TPA: 3-oxoacyl-[acyl-carrier-protein] synthase III C-terminal domain-containing protein [Myxococcaceae bacterium]|jgi:3-oxoacyl-[acyl-carrier-protein] synthase-3
MELKAFQDLVIAFLMRATGRSLEQLGPDTNFVRNGVVDSALFTQLFAFVEELIGRKIPTRGLKVGRFDTIRKIYEDHVAPASPAAEAGAPAGELPLEMGGRAAARESAEPRVTGFAYRVGELRPVQELGVEPDLVEILLAGGLETYSRARQTAVELAQEAAGETLRLTSCAPGDVDAVVFANESVWSDGAVGQDKAGDMRREIYRALHGLGLTRAYPVGAGLSGCANMLAGVGMARGLILTAGLRNVLVVGSDRRADGHRLIPPAVGVISDGAASCLVTAKAGPGFIVEALCQHADLSLHESDLSKDFGRYLLEMGKAVKALGERMRELTGRSADAYKRLVLNNYGASTMRMFAHQLGFRTDQMYRRNVARLSHVAAADIAINLADLEAAGELQSGDRVMAFASGPVSWIMVAARKA